MKRTIKSMMGYAMGATDGEIGQVQDFYFDDDTSTIRYLVVKTGSWLFGRKVLIPTEAVQSVNWDKREFAVNLTKEQILKSPDIDTDKPVSRQQEETLHTYYPWQGYWGSGIYAGGMWGVMPAAPIFAATIHEDSEEIATVEDDVHLRSADRVSGYKIHATDGEIGEVTDFIINDSTWKLEYLVVNTGGWVTGKEILLATKWVTGVNWGNSVVIVNISVKAIENCPAYDPSTPVNEKYENNLYDYYGRMSER